MSDRLQEIRDLNVNRRFFEDGTVTPLYAEALNDDVKWLLEQIDSLQKDNLQLRAVLEVADKYLEREGYQSTGVRGDIIHVLSESGS